MSEEALVLSEIDGAVATLTLNRPKALNALSVELMAELIDLIEAMDADDKIRCLVLTGGRGFSPREPISKAWPSERQPAWSRHKALRTGIASGAAASPLSPP